ncbi:MAG TPA: ATP synthase F1 subunit delta [Acidimicrobiales bacterium]|jgi:F-type H+-transporting ATPase subunit delta
MAEASRSLAYAAAMYAVANAEGQLSSVGDELFAVARAIEGNDALRDALGDPHLPAERRQQIIEDLAGSRTSDVTLSLASMVVAAGRGRELPDIVDALLQLSAEDQGRQVAEVRSAIELSEDQQERLAAALKSATGRDVDVRVVVDPTVVGGLVVRVGDQVIDGTVRHRLSQLRESLSARS